MRGTHANGLLQFSVLLYDELETLIENTEFLIIITYALLLNYTNVFAII